MMIVENEMKQIRIARFVTQGGFHNIKMSSVQ